MLFDSSSMLAHVRKSPSSISYFPASPWMLQWKSFLQKEVQLHPSQRRKGESNLFLLEEAFEFCWIQPLSFQEATCMPLNSKLSTCLSTILMPKGLSTSSLCSQVAWKKVFQSILPLNHLIRIMMLFSCNRMDTSPLEDTIAIKYHTNNPSSLP